MDMIFGNQEITGFRLMGAIVLVVLLGACTTAPVRVPGVPALENQVANEIPDVDLLRVSPQMREFADRYGHSSHGEGSRAWSLAYAALDPYLLDFEYDPHITLPADEAFETGRGNCLTFSSLFVAMAREVGLIAWYQEVKIPPVWSNVNQTMLVSKHVNAVVRDRKRNFTVDVSGRKKPAVEQVRRLSDTEAKAQYFNNLGADALIDENLPLAHAYFSKGLESDSQAAYIWSNLGVVLRRNGQTEDAILAYQTAMGLEPQQAVPLNNLYTIYEEDGYQELAEGLRVKVERNRRKNPYYLHYLAEVANEEQRYSDAIKLLSRAIDIDGNEYRFYFTLAQTQFLSGKTDVAHENLEQARRLAPDTIESGVLILPDGGL